MSMKGNRNIATDMKEVFFGVGRGLVRTGRIGLPRRVNLNQMQNHYEPSKSENIKSIDVFTIPTFCTADGRQQFADIKVIDVAEFSERTKDELLTAALRTHTTVSRDTPACPDSTFIVLADKEEKGFRMKFMSQKGHTRPKNGQGSDFWMVFHRKQSGAFIRKKIYEVLGTWLDKRCAAIKETVERKGFTLFGPIEKCVKFVSLLARGLQKLAERISYVTKEEKAAVKRSSKWVKKAARVWGVKFNKKKGDWIYEDEWSDYGYVERRVKEIAESQGIYIDILIEKEEEAMVDEVLKRQPAKTVLAV